ncbi:hypothetical protein [Bradyrhizobium sp. RDI18]|uniref:hypothetical protein n=1 Tax=Bradyrhizobium sp. RDI18 TaxID=3367400 RepID=UPI00371860B5
MIVTTAPFFLTKDADDNLTKQWDFTGICREKMDAPTFILFDPSQRRDTPTRSCWAGFSHVTERAMVAQIKAKPILESAISLFSDWLKHRQEMRELRDMNSNDFARIARDLCVSPAELDAVVRQGPHASDELPRLLKSLDIDEATLASTQPVLQRDMVRVCAACQQKARCNHDLDAGTLTQNYEEYCPNALAIDELGERP